ncbi:MAG: InlB B-repeat-containing protein, partial [Planctomycetota bacterium]
MKTTTTNLLKAILVGACVVQFASVAAGQTVPADIDISPSVLNLGSAGSMIGCSVRLPQAYSATDIDNENVLSAKFRRSDVQDILGPVGSGEVEIRISGQLADGTEFAGTDTITITHGTHTLTPSAGPHGSISPSEPMTVLYGDSQAFTATPDTGYEVDAWSLDGSVVQTGGTTYTASNVQAAHTVGVTFKRLPYRLTPSAGPHGSISPAEP